MFNICPCVLLLGDRSKESGSGPYAVKLYAHRWAPEIASDVPECVQKFIGPAVSIVLTRAMAGTRFFFENSDLPNDGHIF